MLEFKATLFVLLTFILIYKNLELLIEDFFSLNLNWTNLYFFTFVIMSYFFYEIIREMHPFLVICFYILPFSFLVLSFFKRIRN